MTRFTAKCLTCGKPARPSRNPICGDCFMDKVQRADPRLHDRIVETNDAFADRRPKTDKGDGAQ